MLMAGLERVDEARLVEAWRWDRARELGYEPDDCWTIARNVRIDLHELGALIAAGWDRQVALQILG